MNPHEGFILWFTGLSGAGKTTICEGLAKIFQAYGFKYEVLDGDVVRTHLSKGLGFSKEDRDINIRRIGFVCQLLSRNGVIAISAAISPYQDIRDEIRQGANRFVEVFVNCPLEVCAQRDVKGLYEKAMRGEIQNFTGVSDPYESPQNPEIIIHTHQETPEESVRKIMEYLMAQQLI